jgi:hypothetical protein
MVSFVPESASWRCVEAAPPIRVTLDAAVSVRAERRGTLTAIEGIAAEIEPGGLRLDDGQEEHWLRFTLPDRVDLAPLLGKRLRVTLHTEPMAEGPAEQQLTIADDAGRVLLVAHLGRVLGEAHVIGETRLVAALSQRRGGPMVFGTRELQCLVHAGAHVTLHEGGRELVMHFAARTRAGHAAYVIVDRALWR